MNKQQSWGYVNNYHPSFRVRPHMLFLPTQNDGFYSVGGHTVVGHTHVQAENQTLVGTNVLKQFYMICGPLCYLTDEAS